MSEINDWEEIPVDDWEEVPINTSPVTTSKSDYGRLPFIATGGANKSIAGMAGLPVDIINKTLGLVGLGSQQPIMGSEWIGQFMPSTPKPQGFVENTVGALGEQVPAMLPGIGMASKAQPIMKAIMDAIKVGGGAGLASGGMRTITDNPYADMAAQLFGGVAGGLTIPSGQTASQIEQQTGKIINKGMNKGVRPSVVGKGTYSQAQQYAERAQKAVQTIIENKPNLKITDETGMQVNKLPENLQEFSQAIEQTKGQVFQKYNLLSKQAGQQMAKIDTTDIAKELSTIANNKVVIQNAPDAATYAASRMKAYGPKTKKSSLNEFMLTGKREYTVPNTYTAEQAQDAITHLNASLEAFYKRPSYDTASKAGIDAMIVNRLRKSLDDVIEQSVGPGYQELKNTYGALKAVEKDVVHRSIVAGRQNPKGFFDLTDVWSGAEVIHGILSFNPALVGMGVAANRIKWYMKLMNDPNRIVKNMFSSAEQTMATKPSVSSRGPLMSMEAIKQLQESGSW